MAVALIASGLLACTAKPPTDPRLPSEIAAPSLEDWRAAAGDLASKIAQDAAGRRLVGPATLSAVLGEVPPYFNDLLLANLVERGVQIAQLAEAGTAPLHITCRTAPGDISPYPRGLVVEPAQLRAEILIFCLLAHQGAYIAAQQHWLPVRPPRPQTRGIVIEVTG
jgi:hypothetical protein